jgi:signal transduction histidine kinase
MWSLNKRGFFSSEQVARARPHYALLAVILTTTLLASFRDQSSARHMQTAEDEPGVKRVLLIHQHGQNRPSYARFVAAFAEALRVRDSDEFDVYQETIEIERSPDGEQLRPTADYLKHKYEDRKIDVMVVVGNAALTFARRNREMFGNPPIVALATPDQFGMGDAVSGLQIIPTFGRTLDLALTLRPTTRSVFVIDGARGNNGDVEADFRRQWHERQRSIGLVYLRDIPLSDVVTRVASAPDDSIVLFVRQTMWDHSEDVDLFEALSQVVRASRVPIFSVGEQLLGRGIVGGYLRQPEAEAKRTAEIAQRIANGTGVRDLPPGEINATPMLDWRQLQRWQIPETRIPPGSIVLFRPESFFDPYRRYFVGGLIVFAGQLALIVGLLVQRVRRRRAEEESRKSEEAIGHLEARNTAMLRAIPDLMFVLSRDGTYVDYYARDPNLLLLPPDQFIGRTIRDIMPSGLADALMGAIERACITNDPVVVEYELAMSEPRYFEARLVCIEHDRVLSIVRDVTESKRTLELNRNLAGRLIESQEAERARIARDLHDDVCQEIAAISVDVSQLRRQSGDIGSPDVQNTLLDLQQRAENVAENLRLLSHGLHPSVLHHIGLVAALRAHCAEVERHHQLQVRFVAEGEVEPPNRLVALALYRIAQEALRNATRHAHARHATISLTRFGTDLTLTVSDDGRGFDPVAMRSRGAGLGLVSIEERVRIVKGQLTVESQTGRGTTIAVRVPVKLDDHADGLQSEQQEGIARPSAEGPAATA